MADKNYSDRGLFLLVTVVNRSKADFYMDVIQSFEANFQTAFLAEGTARPENMSKLDYTDSEKVVITSVIREDKTKDALRVLDSKFKTVRNGNGIAFTIPFSSVIGLSVFEFLSNTKLPAREVR